MLSDLGGLADPHLFRENLDVTGCDPSWVLEAYKTMFLIRTVEETIADLVVSGTAKTPCHLAIGQEAISVGVASIVRASDKAFGSHRSHGHFLAMGGGIKSLLCEVLGKLEGCSRGMGGSMHLCGKDFGFVGSVPLVGATIPLAVGAGLTQKMTGNGDIAVAFFGDGAMEEGVVHESLNFASTYRVPVLFVCENNLFSSHLDILLRQPGNRVARIAEAHMVPARVVDGNDVICVSDAARALTESMRVNGGPAFLEAVTYRWRGHVGPNEDIDVGVRRSAEEVRAWKARDPIARCRGGMIAGRLADRNAIALVEEEIRAAVFDAVEYAKKAAYPEPGNLLSCVYAGMSK